MYTEQELTAMPFNQLQKLGTANGVVVIGVTRVTIVEELLKKQLGKALVVPSGITQPKKAKWAKAPAETKPAVVKPAEKPAVTKPEKTEEAEKPVVDKSMWDSIGPILAAAALILALLVAFFGIRSCSSATQIAPATATPASPPANNGSDPTPTPAAPATETPQASTETPTPAANATEGDFSNWSYDQMKSYVSEGEGFEEQNSRFWRIANWGIESGTLHNTESASEDDCLGIFPEFATWGSHDSCGIAQSDPQLKGTWTLSVTEVDLLFKSRHDWGNLNEVVLWETPAIRYGGEGDIVATVTYPGEKDPQICVREFELFPGMSVSLVNSTKGEHQITYGETKPDYDNECRPEASSN